MEKEALILERQHIKTDMAELQRDLEAVERLIARCKTPCGESTPMRSDGQSAILAGQGHHRSGMTGGARIRAAINSLDGEFDLGKVAAALAGEDPPVKKFYISAVLSKLRKDGNLELVTKGAGGKAARYKKKG